MGLLRVGSLLLPSGAAGCFPDLTERDFRSGPVQIECCGEAQTEVELRFLGVGGWLITSPLGQVLTAPLFTNPDKLTGGAGIFTSDTIRIAEGLEFTGASDLSRVEAVLVGHGHYDHLLDVPWVAARLAPRSRVLSTTTARIQIIEQARAFGLSEDRLVDVSDRMATNLSPGEWIQTGPGFRVLPIYSDHAPHLAGITLFSGERKVAMPREPLASNEWLDGVTVAWLIDALAADGSTIMRIFYQDAVAREPVGLVPPREVLGDEIPIDVAIIVPATYAEVDWHPELLIESTEASHILLGHWEDFSVPVTEPSVPVIFTLLPDFIARLRRATDCNDTCWDLPRPGASFTFRAHQPGRPPAG